MDRTEEAGVDVRLERRWARCTTAAVTKTSRACPTKHPRGNVDDRPQEWSSVPLADTESQSNDAVIRRLRIDRLRIDLIEEALSVTDGSLIRDVLTSIRGRCPRRSYSTQRPPATPTRQIVQIVGGAKLTDADAWHDQQIAGQQLVAIPKAHRFSYVGTTDRKHDLTGSFGALNYYC